MLEGRLPGNARFQMAGSLLVQFEREHILVGDTCRIFPMN